MKGKNKFLIVIAFLAIVISSCKKEKTYSEIPEIKFKEFQHFTNSEGVEDSLKLVFSFTDGDGDIGFAQADSDKYDAASPYYYNFHYREFYRQNGEVIEVSLLVPGARIPNEAREKFITGDILMKMFISDLPIDVDTISFECYIYDYALHQSNTIATPEVVVKVR